MKKYMGRGLPAKLEMLPVCPKQPPEYFQRDKIMEVTQKMNNAFTVLYRLFQRDADPANAGKPAPISVSDTDLYMLRELSISYIKVGTEQVGFNLKCKIAKLLFEKSYQQGKTADRLLSEVDMTKILIPALANV